MSITYINKLASVKSYDNPGENILFLRGIYKKDYKKIEQIFQENIINEINMKQSRIKYDKIPATFTGLDTWLSHTNLNCWHCTNKIKFIPKFVPKNIEPRAGDYEKKTKKKCYNISVEGCFCSFNCAQAYIDLAYSKNVYEYINLCNMLLFLYTIFTGKKITFIKPSPNKNRMVQFGGQLSPDEYEKEIDCLDALQQKEIDDNNFNFMCETFLKNIE